MVKGGPYGLNDLSDAVHVANGGMVKAVPSPKIDRIPRRTTPLSMLQPSRPRVGEGCARCGLSEEDCYLVDPASSHMLVSKIKPCMCKYELIQTVKLRMAH